jgi:hypothetical protein
VLALAGLVLDAVLAISIANISKMSRRIFLILLGTAVGVRQASLDRRVRFDIQWYLPQGLTQLY